MGHPTISIWDRRPKITNPVGGEIPLGQPEICNLDPKVKVVCWARSGSPKFYLPSLDGIPLDHWSRKFEYPWVMACGDFKSNELALDAAGGDAPLQTLIAAKAGAVINVDSDGKALERAKTNWTRPNIIRYEGDLLKTGFPDGMFHRVVCASVLEHSQEPALILYRLWRMLIPGGRLLLTFDVASYARWNHTIDLAKASELVKFFGLTVPEKPSDILVARFPEIERKQGDPEFVELNVLCLAVDKEG